MGQGQPPGNQYPPGGGPPGYPPAQPAAPAQPGAPAQPQAHPGQAPQQPGYDPAQQYPQGQYGQPGQPPADPAAHAAQQAAYQQHAGYQDPAAQQAAYQDPAAQQAAYQDPAAQQAAYQDPAAQQAAYQDPAAAQQAAYQDPAAAQQAAYGQPGVDPAAAYGQPGVDPAAAYGQPGVDPAAGYPQEGFDSGTSEQTEDAVSPQKKFAGALLIGGIVTFVFGLLFLITSAVFTSEDGKAIKSAMPATGGIVGPITVAKDNQVLLIEVKQRLNGLGWSYVNGEMLDAEQEFLFGFGYELWHETGYDEGHWDEQENNYDIKVTVPKKGTYFASFDTEQQPGVPIGGDINVKITPKLGSAVPHFAAGLLLLVFGLMLAIAGVWAAPVQLKTADDDD